MLFVQLEPNGFKLLFPALITQTPPPGDTQAPLHMQTVILGLLCKLCIIGLLGGTGGSTINTGSISWDIALN